LLLRLQLPSVLFRNAQFAVALKEDENDLAPNVSRTERTLRTGVGARLPLAPLQLLLGATPATEYPRKLGSFLLQVPIRPENLALVQKAAAQAQPDEALRATLVSLLSLPEYQLA
jgi:hypothetical protein